MRQKACFRTYDFVKKLCLKNIFCHRKFQYSIFKIYFLRIFEKTRIFVTYSISPQVIILVWWLFWNNSSGITMGYLCQGPPIERVVTAIKLKRRRGGVLPIYHRASILDYENFWISRSDTILLNNKSLRNIHFSKISIFCNGVSVVFSKPKSGALAEIAHKPSAFSVGYRPETGSESIINGKWTLGVFPIKEIFKKFNRKDLKYF